MSRDLLHFYEFLKGFDTPQKPTTMNEHETCHKCGGEGMLMETHENGYGGYGLPLHTYHYECCDCDGSWMVDVDGVPVARTNEES